MSKYEYKHWCGNCQIKIYVQRHEGKILTWQDCPYTCEYATAMRCSTEAKGENNSYTISRQVASGCEYWDSESNLCSLHRPSAEKTGEWKNIDIIHDRKDAKITDWQQAQCSVCGKWHTTPYLYCINLDPYCPSCGAKMVNDNE